MTNFSIYRKTSGTLKIPRKTTGILKIDMPIIIPPPAFVSAEVGLIDAYTIDMLFDRALNEARIPDAADLIPAFSGGAYTDWFLGSRSEVDLMRTVLHDFGIGGFSLLSWYWTSSEVNATNAESIDFTDGSVYDVAKGQVTGTNIRACRSFTSLTVYALRDVGPAGGWIIYKSGNDYLEAAPADTTDSVWSNITNLAIGTTLTTIGEGQNNTNEIIAQVGHTTSAAKICDNYSAGNSDTITLITISGLHVYATISRAITFGETGTIQYVPNALAAKQLQGTTGAKVAAFTESVTNNVAVSIPVLVPPIIIADATPTKIKIPYDLALDETSIPAVGSYVLGSGKTVTLVEVSGLFVYLTASSRYYWGDTETVAYTKPATNMIKSTLGGEAASFTATAVINFAGLDDAGFDNGKLLITFDDGKVSQYTNVLPILISKNVNATFYVRPNIVGADYLTASQLLEMNQLGMDMECHTVSHDYMTGLTDEQIIAELLAVNANFVGVGLPTPTHSAYPSGVADERVKNIFSQYRLTGRGVSSNLFYRTDDRFYINATALDGVSDIASIKLLMDEAKARNLAMSFYGHDLGTGGGMSIALFSELIDYAQSIGLDIITISEFYELIIMRLKPNGLDLFINSETSITLKWRNGITNKDGALIERSSDYGANFTQIGEVLGTINEFTDDTIQDNGTSYCYRVRSYLGDYYSEYCDEAYLTVLSLTATGTGSGVSILNVNGYKNSRYYLSGNARFYSNAAGTLGESTFHDFVLGAGTENLYMKCTSGTSYLKFNNAPINIITSWDSAVNSPSLAGNISTLVHLITVTSIAATFPVTGSITNLKRLVTLSVTNANTLSGSITALQMLSVIVVYGTNTIGGDVTLKTKLTNLSLYSVGCLITGSVTNLVNLTKLYVNANTLSGSVSGLTNLTYLEKRGSNTITGSVTNLIKLTWLYNVTGSGMSGDISNLVDLAYFRDELANTYSGSITNLTKLTTLYVSGQNTITGSVNGLTLLTYLQLEGTNTISGDVKILSSKLTRLYLPSCAIVDYTSGGDWSKIIAAGLVRITPRVGYGMSSAEVDLLIIEIAATKVAGRAVNVTLTGSNAARTSASDAARTAILADGGTVTTN